jgi:hypothetical protein
MHRLHNVQRTSHTKTGNTSRFQLPGKQSDGLVTHRSNRHEHRHIDLIG